MNLRFGVTVRRAVVPMACLITLTAPTPGPADTVPVCRASAGLDPFTVDLVPTAAANGARGTVGLRFADSPFGVTVTGDGHHAYRAQVETSGLPKGRALVVWAATPALDEVVRLGVLDDDGRLAAQIALNKFLVFVTAEASPLIERWSGPILLRGISPSGRMHTMAGHGPFQGEPCGNVGFRSGVGSL